MNEIKVFLASSSELELERTYVGDMFNDINSVIDDANVRLRLLKWEIFNPSYTGERKQNEYDEQVKRADVFIVLFRTIAGKFTLEEAEVAEASHAGSNRPEELHCLIQDFSGERRFNPDELKAQLATYKMDSFADIGDLKLKIMRILMPRLTALGVDIKEDEKFLKVGAVNVLRK